MIGILVLLSLSLLLKEKHTPSSDEPGTGFQPPVCEKNREKRHYKNQQRLQLKEEKEKQIRNERRQRRRGVEGCACDCDFSGGLAFKGAFLCKVNKFVNIEEIKSNLT